jgi:hypothetical protein
VAQQASMEDGKPRAFVYTSGSGWRTVKAAEEDAPLDPRSVDWRPAHEGIVLPRLHSLRTVVVRPGSTAAAAASSPA